MSTATINPSALAISYGLVTRARIAFNTGTDDKPEWEYKEVSEKDATEVETTGKFKDYPARVDGTQTFKVPSANNLEGIQQLVPSEEEIVNLFSSGMSVKLGNKMRSRILATDKEGNYTFEFSEDPFDLTADAATITNRRLTEDEKLTKSLTEVQLSPEKIQELLAVLQAKLASSGASQGQITA